MPAPQFAALLLTFLVTASSWQSAFAFFRLSCGTLTTERIDPLLSPGEVFSHVHGNFGPDATYDKLRQSTCTSCRVKQDLSAYWSNTLAFQYKNGSVEFLAQHEKAVYYKQLEDNTQEPFPNGFSMIAGDPTRTTFDASDPAHQAISFTCLNAIGNTSATPDDTHDLPEAACKGGIRGNVQFPTCWNGKTTSDDHKSHVAYEDSSGSCPSGYSRRLPSLLFEAIWYTPDFDGKRKEAKNPKQPYILSTDDTTGYSLHADFQSGWKEEILAEALRNCTMEAFDPQQCTYLDVDTSGACFRGPDTTELVQSLSGAAGPVLAALPGQKTSSNSDDDDVSASNADVQLCASPQVYTTSEQVASGCTGGTESASDESDQDDDTTSASTRTTAVSTQTSNSNSDNDEENEDSDDSQHHGHWPPNESPSSSSASDLESSSSGHVSGEGTTVDSGSVALLPGNSSRDVEGFIMFWVGMIAGLVQQIG